MTDNKYQSQMSKAIDVAQLKNGTVHAADVHPSELPNIIPYLPSLFWGKYSNCMAFHYLIKKYYYARAHRIAIQQL